MYGSKEMSAFCCNCKELTRHQYTMFGSQTEQSPKEVGLLQKLLSAFVTTEPAGDYKCSRCGTYLESPDHLD